jgi:2-oxoisovalerate dehydrogenase E1 component alpha subunit
MNHTGEIVGKELFPNELTKETILKMYKTMVLLNQMDIILYDVQRQGRISFYMTNFGEEATHIGSASALDLNDIIFGQYREAGVLLWRGFTLDEFMNQCYSNRYDYGKGRQMPVHYGSKKLNFQTISSPLATQLPQASGSAYAQKLLGLKQCTITYFGEGAASEGDFHAALNFAATLQTPTIFFCRNNHWAISTPYTEQFKSDGIAGRGISYGIDTIRVDGNDIFAVYYATKQARKKATEEYKPIVIEAITYRLGHHSTSDDSSRYRSNSEVEEWRQKYHPISRLYKFLINKNWWNEEEDKTWKLKARNDVLEALKRAEAEKKPPIEELFSDVYDEIPPHLLEQKKELEEHLSKYPENYSIDQYQEK